MKPLAYQCILCLMFETNDKEVFKKHLDEHRVNQIHNRSLEN